LVVEKSTNALNLKDAARNIVVLSRAREEKRSSMREDISYLSWKLPKRK